MTIARKVQINLNETPYYHCIGRCVRRSFLYGDDPVAQRSYNHRKAWVITQLQSLCSVFAIKVCAYAVMSNHYHLVLCVEPEAVKALSDEEVILRVKHINTLRMHGTFSSAKEHELEKIITPEKIEEYREKLTSISSFMGALNEYLARKANREDECKGRFWEGRFKSMALVDDGALLACMAYVDLNPIKAGMASSLEKSDFTSIQERIGIKQENELQVEENPANPGLRQHLGTFASADIAKPHIPCSWENYHQLVEWTQQQLVSRKSTSLTPAIEQFLNTLQIEPDTWLLETKQLEKTYSWAVGSFEKLKTMVKNRGLHWVRGMKKSKTPFLTQEFCSS
jgi:REP element-mobilizing transposase RayT